MAKAKPKTVANLLHVDLRHRRVGNLINRKIDRLCYFKIGRGLFTAKNEPVVVFAGARMMGKKRAVRDCGFLQCYLIFCALMDFSAAAVKVASVPAVTMWKFTKPESIISNFTSNFTSLCWVWEKR